MTYSFPPKSYAVLTGIFLLVAVFLVVRYAVQDKTPDSTAFTVVSYPALDHWAQDQQGLALAAFQKSCAYFMTRPPATPVIPESIGGTVADWQDVCRKAARLHQPSHATARRFFEDHFTPLSYRPLQTGLFTGYFAPEYDGSRTPSATYSSPLYRLPDDVQTLHLGDFDPDLQGRTIIGQVTAGRFVPYADRKAIDQGALADRALELVWLKDPVDAFFMHIQGSGIIRYTDGTRQLFGYAGKNGHPYQAVGRFLIDSGAVPAESMSMQRIRGWIQDHPDLASTLLWKNPAYIFFRPLDGAAPVGAMTVELTAGRSLAIDQDYMPLGMPVWLDLDGDTTTAPLRRLVIAQDTGSAIKGPVRGDLYWGTGPEAGQRAGPMKQAGRAYFLLPNALAQVLFTRGAVE